MAIAELYDPVEQAVNTIVRAEYPHRHALRIEDQAASPTDRYVIENIAAVGNRHAGGQAHGVGIEDETLLVNRVIGYQLGADRVGRHVPFLYGDGLRDLADGNAVMLAGT